MSNILEISFIMSCVSLGVFVASRNGMILYPIRKYVNKLLNFLLPEAMAKYTAKPLFECPPCMASFWGGGLYLVVYGTFDLNLLVCILMCSFLNKLLVPYVE